MVTKVLSHRFLWWNFGSGCNSSCHCLLISFHSLWEKSNANVVWLVSRQNVSIIPKVHFAVWLQHILKKPSCRPLLGDIHYYRITSFYTKQMVQNTVTQNKKHLHLKNAKIYIQILLFCKRNPFNVADMLSSKIASQEGNCEHLIGSDPSHDQINQSDEGIPIKSVAKNSLQWYL